MTKKEALRYYQQLMLIRKTEEKIVELYPQGEMRCPTHLCMGEEAIAVGVCANLKPSDQIMSFYRSHGHFLAKGGDLKKMMAEIYGKSTGILGGRGGSMLLADPNHGIMGASAIVGGGLPIATGLAWANKLKKNKKVMVCFFGDAAVEEGVFHESLNFASLQKLPIVFVCENNFYAVHSPLHQRRASDNIIEHAKGYALPGIRIDGNDLPLVLKTANQAVARARRGLGPTLLECRTYRLRGHIESFLESTEYRSKKEVAFAKKNDPLRRFTAQLLKTKLATKAELQKIDARVNHEINEAVQFAKTSPSPKINTLFSYVYPKT